MSRCFCFSPRRRSFAHLEPEIFRAGDGAQRVPEEVSFWISKVGWFNPTDDETLGVCLVFNFDQPLVFLKIPAPLPASPSTFWPQGSEW